MNKMASIEELSKETPVLVFGGHVYQLAVKTTAKQELKAEVEKLGTNKVLVDSATGVVFELVPVADTASLEEIISSEVEKKILSRQTDSSKEINKLRETVELYRTATTELMPALGSGVGLIENKNKLYVFLNVERYILNDVLEGNGYFLYPATRVAVELKLTRNGLSHGEPIVLGRYNHPFVSWQDGTAEDSDLCWTGAGWSDDYYRSIGTLPKRIMYVLEKTKQLLQTGYIRGVNPRSYPSRNSRGLVRRIGEDDVEQLKKEKVYVTNTEIKNG